MNLDILLTDGNFKHTYAALRALKSNNLKVGIIFNSFTSLSVFSRYTDKRFFIKHNINNNPDEVTINSYKEALINILRENTISVIIPVGNISYYLFSKYYNEISIYSKIIIANEDTMILAQNKFNTFLFAQNNNFNIPKTFFPSSNQELISLSEMINFPCILKRTNFNEGGVIYCNDKQEYEQVINNNFKGLTSQLNTPPIIQEYIKGKAYGFYALFNNGKCLSYFMHERIHEYPITGGSSTFAKSFYDSDLLMYGKSLLEKLNWHGPAMVEFKRDDNDNQFKLIEINPKLWGSLELSTISGINFPYQIYLLATNKQIINKTYEKDIYFRWTIPHDLLWMHFAEKKKQKEFLILKKNVKIKNNIHYDDPIVILFNLVLYLYMLLRDKKYPHGFIKE